MSRVPFFSQRVFKFIQRLTKRAPDAGDSAHTSSSFTRLSLFLVGRLRRPRPAQVTQTVGWQDKEQTLKDIQIYI